MSQCSNCLSHSKIVDLPSLRWMYDMNLSCADATNSHPSMSSNKPREFGKAFVASTLNAVPFV